MYSCTLCTHVPSVPYKCLCHVSFIMYHLLLRNIILLIVPWYDHYTSFHSIEYMEYRVIVNHLLHPFPWSDPHPALSLHLFCTPVPLMSHPHPHVSALIPPLSLLPSTSSLFLSSKTNFYLPLTPDSVLLVHHPLPISSLLLPSAEILPASLSCSYPDYERLLTP